MRHFNNEGQLNRAHAGSVRMSERVLLIGVRQCPFSYMVGKCRRRQTPFSVSSHLAVLLHGSDIPLGKQTNGIRCEEFPWRGCGGGSFGTQHPAPILIRRPCPAQESQENRLGEKVLALKNRISNGGGGPFLALNMTPFLGELNLSLDNRFLPHTPFPLRSFKFFI